MNENWMESKAGKCNCNDELWWQVIQPAVTLKTNFLSKAIRKFFSMEVYYNWKPFVYGGISSCIAEFGNKTILFALEY